MASTSLGTAWIQIKPSLSGVTGSIKKDLQGLPSDISGSIASGAKTGGEQMSNTLKGVFSGLGSNIKSTFSTAFKAVATIGKASLVGATAGVTALVAKSANLYADYEQLAGGVETLFKDSANAVLDYSNMAFQTAQISANEYMETVTSFSASLLQSLGGDTAKAAKYADQAIIDMADNSNKMGTAMEMIQNAYQGFAKQNFTMLDNLKLGYGGTRTEMQRLLSDAEKISGIKFSIDSFADITQAIHVVQENLGIAGTSSQEAAETISGSLKSMKSAWKNVMTFFGGGTAMAWNDIFPQFVNTVKTFGKNIIPVVSDILSNIASLISELAPQIIASLPKLFSEIIPPLLSSVVGIFTALVEVFPALIQSVVNALKELLSNQEQIQTIISGFVQLFVAVANAAGEIALTLIPMIPQIIGTIVGEISKPENAGTVIAAFGVLFGIGTFKTIAGNLGGVLKSTIGSKFTSFFKTDIAQGVGESAGSAVKSIGSNLSEAIKGIASPLKTAFTELGSILTSAVNAVAAPVKAALVGIAEAVKAFLLVFADPQIAIGAALFAVAAAAIAAAIWLLGSAIGAIMPMLEALFNNILIPLMQFVVDTVMTVIKTLADVVTTLIQGALIPLASFIRDTFLAIIKTMGDVITGLINGAVRPLIEVLAGAFTSVLNAVANILNGVISAALNGIRGIVDAVGDGFIKMGQAVQIALSGVQGVLSVFAQMLSAISSALVAIVALATHQSVSYGAGYAQVTAAATGGLVGGIGTETSDSNLFALSKGEYVIRASAARKIGYDNLDKMNEDGALAGGNVNTNITINGYNKDPNELADIISRKIALKTRGVY